jgi:hypothetical protein
VKIVRGKVVGSRGLDTEVRENRSRADIEARDEDDVEVRLGDARR